MLEGTKYAAAELELVLLFCHYGNCLVPESRCRRGLGTRLTRKEEGGAYTLARGHLIMAEVSPEDKKEEPSLLNEGRYDYHRLATIS